MQTINMDITKVEFGVIVHQVNCQGVMGSGVAKAIRDKWPSVYESYIHAYESHVRQGIPHLGEIDVCPINEHLFVVNLFGQDNYKRGIDDHWSRFTSYGAWELALPKLKRYLIENGLPNNIWLPYNVGCDRGGGDFRIISAMIEEHFPNAIFCKV